MAFLAGNKDAYDVCLPKKNYLDNCGFLWTNFREAGYYTGYGEDAVTYSTFNFNKKGFDNPPTDFYMRPLTVAMEKTLSMKTKFGSTYCAGNRPYGEYIYDYALEFARRLKDEPSFGFFWTNTFTHENFVAAKFMDNAMLRYLEQLKEEGILDTSIVFLMSDHGARWGPLLTLPSGFYEERLPMFFISIPKWFRDAYPEWIQNLQINAKRLTSPNDLFLTLQQLLQISDRNYTIRSVTGCPKCFSLLNEVVPWNRTCWWAGIPYNWCSCTDPFQNVDPPKEFSTQMATNLVEVINNYIEYKDLRNNCHKLRLEKVTTANTLHRSSSENYLVTYKIIFTTKPETDPETIFSAVVEYDVKHSAMVNFSIKDVNRMSVYRNTSLCLSGENDSEALPYCICKDMPIET